MRIDTCNTAWHAVEALAKLPSMFKKDGLVTAGNASGISDGAGLHTHP